MKKLLTEQFVQTTKTNEQLYKAIDLGVDFQNSKNLSNPIIDYKNIEQIWNELDLKMNFSEKSIESTLEEFKTTILNNSINMNHPNYVGFPDIATSISGQIGSILAAFMNQNIINSETASPAATLVTVLVIKWFRKLIGYKENMKYSPNSFDIGGIPTFGGVGSNSTSILIAREKAIKKYGKERIKDFRIIAPAGISHYSVRRAAFLFGMSEDTMVYADVDGNYKIIPGKVKEQIVSLKRKNKIPIALVAYAGNSRTMGIDKLDELAEICMEHDIWLEVDACHGFSLSFSDNLKNKLKGIEKADSITIDPHKVLFLPYNVSYVLLKRPKDVKYISEVADIVTTEPLSFGVMTPFIGSNGFNSLKLWFLIKTMGKKNIGNLIEQRVDLVEKFSTFMKNQKNFIVLNEVEINSLAFYYYPEKIRERCSDNHILRVNKINETIFRKVFETGKFYVHSFHIKDIGNRVCTDKKYTLRCLRVMPGNPFTKLSNLKELVQLIEKIGNEMISN